MWELDSAKFLGAQEFPESTTVGRKVAIILGDIRRFRRLKKIYEKLVGSHGVRLLSKATIGKWATKAI